MNVPSKTTTHTYTAGGTFKAILTVSNDGGSDTCQALITVGQPVSPSLLLWRGAGGEMKLKGQGFPANLPLVQLVVNVNNAVFDQIGVQTDSLGQLMTIVVPPEQPSYDVVVYTCPGDVSVTVVVDAIFGNQKVTSKAVPC